MTTITKNIPTDRAIEEASKVVIGADPEIFVRKNKVNVSAHELIPGTKAHPFKVKDGAVQVDGTALEFNIDPAGNSRQFVSNIQSVMAQLSDMVKSKDSSVEFDISPVAIYGKDLFDSIPEEAKELGCEPDFNAYTGTINPRPDSSLLKGLETMRTASGHVHIGWTSGADKSDPSHFEDCKILTRFLDYTLGNAQKDWDTDAKRSRLYGAPGAFRPKAYGMEYRVLSNKWLEDPARCAFVFEVAKKCAQILMIYGLGSMDRIMNMGSKPSFHASNYEYWWGSMLPRLPGKKGSLSSGSYMTFKHYFPDNLKALEEAYANAV